MSTGCILQGIDQASYLLGNEKDQIVMVCHGGESEQWSTGDGWNGRRLKKLSAEFLRGWGSRMSRREKNRCLLDRRETETT